MCSAAAARAQEAVLREIVETLPEAFRALGISDDCERLRAEEMAKAVPILRGMWHLSPDAYEYFKRQFPDDDNVVPAGARISRLHQDGHPVDEALPAGR
jgi:hypothetical protein